jgi:hypothetical protein
MLVACLDIERLPEMSSFDLSAFVRTSTEAQGVPERLEDADTVLAVVRAITLAKQSLWRLDRRPTHDCPARPTSANEHHQATTA